MKQMTLVLTEAGIPNRWATWQDAVLYAAKSRIIWEAGEYEWTKYGGVSRITGERSSAKVSSIIAVRGIQMPKGNAPALNNKNLFIRDRKVCAYCGGTFSQAKLTNDHIIPKSKGGKHSWDNCVTSCKPCNSRKENHLLEDIDMQLLYIPYTPSLSEALIMKNRHILADQMDFIQKVLPRHSRLLSI